MNRQQFVFAFVMVACCAWQTASAQLVGGSPFDAAPVGKTVQGIMDCGSNYEGNEAYNIKVTVLQFARGDMGVKAALGMEELPPPAEGTEYLVVNVRFDYKARGRPGNCVHTVRPEHFNVLSSNGFKYSMAALALPLPGMSGEIKSGESMEGWVLYEVIIQDFEPLMSFSVGEGSVAHGGELWFKLYE